MNIQKFINQVEKTGSGSYNITGGDVSSDGKSIMSGLYYNSSVSDAVKEFIQTYGIEADLPDRFIDVQTHGPVVYIALKELITNTVQS